MVRLRAFRAIEDPETCEKFIEGHTRVLHSVGVKKVTSNKVDWMYWGSVFVMVVEDTETGEVLGGARIHAHDGINPLPVQDATSYMDDKVIPYIDECGKTGTGEICGLWNSMKVAGMGFGSVFLSRASVAIVDQIGLNNLLALCAPYTVRPAKIFGYSVVEEIGNNGTFYYPKLDLLATFMVMQDAIAMPDAMSVERDKVLDLRKNPFAVVQETTKVAEVEIKYDLKLTDIPKDTFHIK